ELADAVVGHVPSGRSGGLRQQLHDTDIGERIGLQAAQRAWNDEAVEAGGMKLLDQRLRQALLALELVVVAPDDRLQRGGGPHRRLSLDVGRQPLVFRDLAHVQRMFRWRKGGVKRYCPRSSLPRRAAHVAFEIWRVPRAPPPDRGAPDAAVPPGP